jgi:hypothetical protein
MTKETLKNIVKLGRKEDFILESKKIVLVCVFFLVGKIKNPGMKKVGFVRTNTIIK